MHYAAYIDESMPILNNRRAISVLAFASKLLLMPASEIAIAVETGISYYDWA